MAKGDKLIVYGIGIFTLSALLLAWMSHSGRAGSKAEHPSAAGIPVMGASPSEAPAPSTTEGSPSPSANQPMATPEERHSSTESDARPADRPARSQADTSHADKPLPPDLSAPSDEGLSPPDSGQLLSPSQGETAAQRVARRLRRH